MTVTTTTLTARRPQGAGTGWPKLLARTLGSEWVKLRSVRSTYGSLAAAVVVTVAIAALAAWAITTDDQPNPAPATQLAAVGASVGQFGLVALAITGEFATGSIRTTLAATPARWAVLTAKAAVVGAVTFPAGLVATALATLTASTILGIGTDSIGAVSARSAAALTLTGVLVVGLGAVLRSAAGTITTAVAVLFAPPILGAIVSNEVVATVMDYLPAGLTTVLVSGTGERYSPQMAALLLGAWAVVALAAGAIALHRRDP
jgi:ABC-2 type transport system permease protein